jgi:hypothetical protein
MYAKWQHLPEHLSAAEARVDALNTWHQSATGKPVTPQQLTHAVTALREVAAQEPANGGRQLTDILDEWAHQQGIPLAPPLVEQQRSVRTGIGIDR